MARKPRFWKKCQGRRAPEQLVFIDETRVRTNMTRTCGWSPRGEKLLAKVAQGHWKTLAFLAALRSDRIDAPLVLEGPINGTSFAAYLKQCLVPTLSPGNIVIMNNLGSHKSPAIRKALRPRRRARRSFPRKPSSRSAGPAGPGNAAGRRCSPAASGTVREHPAGHSASAAFSLPCQTHDARHERDRITIVMTAQRSNGFATSFRSGHPDLANPNMAKRKEFTARSAKFHFSQAASYSPGHSLRNRQIVFNSQATRWRCPPAIVVAPSLTIQLPEHHHLKLL